MSRDSIPVIDVAPLVTGGARAPVAVAIDRACREHGFFYIVGHGVPDELQERLDRLSRAFFALPEERKQAIGMARGGRAWRGYFALGREYTSGLPDHKEGLYFGAELPPGHPRVAARTPLHGANLFPPEGEVPGFRAAALDYIAALTRLGHTLMEGVSLALGQPPEFFQQRYTADPLVLFRIFFYPPLPDAGAVAGDGPRWSVGEHTDYGLLTILRQDDTGGLQVKSGGRWIAAPPVPGAMVCNIGDMLDRMTGGVYRSTPHRVENRSEDGRVSLPFFFDPGWDARVEPLALPGRPARDDVDERWDGESVHLFAGTYGEYLLRKVSRVFPWLVEGGALETGG